MKQLTFTDEEYFALRGILVLWKAKNYDVFKATVPVINKTDKKLRDTFDSIFVKMEL